jgi:hypothetical protein
MGFLAYMGGAGVVMRWCLGWCMEKGFRGGAEGM